jgi:hypothetical protein
MNTFNPDWSSPPSDTIKDILEERGENYDDFVGEAVGWSANYYSIEQVESMFDCKSELEPSITLFLTDKLGSTCDFWKERSALYRVQQEAKNKFADLPRWEPTIHLDPDTFEPDRLDEAIPVLKRILSNCLSAQLKREDAPCSSETHLNTAIALLLELVPDYNPEDEEMKSALEWAVKEGKVLRGEIK